MKKGNIYLDTWKIAKVHLVSGQIGQHVQQLVVKEHSNAKGDVMVQEIAMA